MKCEMSNQKWSCLICKKLADKDKKKGLVGKYLLRSMFWFNSEREAIEHLKKEHPKEYKCLNDMEGVAK